MNFSNTKKLTKVLSLLMALCMTAALFTGCFGKKPAEDTEPPFSLDLNDETTPTDTQTQPAETEPPVINEDMATITAQLNIRSAPNTDAAITGNLYAGDKVEIKTRKTVLGEEWGYISENEGALSGWIQMEYVVMDYQPEQPATTDPTEPESTTATEPTGNATNIKGVITTNGLNIRSEASTDGKVQGSYNKGDVVTIVETKDGWGRTNKGWIKMEFVNTSSGTTTGGNSGNTTGGNSGSSNVSGNGSTNVIAKGVIIAEELNIRASASKNGDKVGTYTYGTRVEILEKSNGWGRTKKGWISLSYMYQDGDTGSNTAKGTISAGGGLNIRSGPGTDYDVVGAYAEGDSVSILEQFTIDGTRWGCTSKGWISMKYVNTGSTESGSGNNNSTASVTGTIITESLRIRSGPGTNFETLGSVNYGDKVTITDRQTVDGTEWGRIAEGWISMKFVQLN